MRLIDLINNAKREYGSLFVNKDSFDILKNTDFSNLIEDNKKCSHLLTITSDILPPIKSFFNIERASHSLILWLLGIGLNNELKILNTNFPSYYALWKFTSTSHDFGYFCEQITNNNLKLEDITSTYNLFKDTYSEDYLSYMNNLRNRPDCKEYFSFTNEEIINYFEYSKYYNEHNNIEKVDHGIVGGCLIFEQCCNEIKLQKEHCINPSILLSEFYKIACFNIASHNIYKSNNIDDDLIYKKFNLDSLLSTSPVKVKKENGLLMLLSLVDTIECSKRFSPTYDKYIDRKIILETININLGVSCITIDFSDLYNYFLKLKEEDIVSNMLDRLNRHLKSIKDLSNWTDFKTEELNNWKIKIYY